MNYSEARNKITYWGYQKDDTLAETLLETAARCGLAMGAGLQITHREGEYNIKIGC